jgi:hypothetical protein
MRNTWRKELDNPQSITLEPPSLLIESFCQGSLILLFRPVFATLGGNPPEDATVSPVLTLVFRVLFPVSLVLSSCYLGTNRVVN